MGIFYATADQGQPEMNWAAAVAILTQDLPPCVRVGNFIRVYWRKFAVLLLVLFPFTRHRASIFSLRPRSG